MELELRRATPRAGGRGDEGPPKATLSIGKEKYELEGSGGGDAGKDVRSAAPPAGAGPIHGRWIFYPVSFAVDPVDWTTGAPLPDERVLFFVNTSVAEEAASLFGEIRVGKSATRSADVALVVMKILGDRRRGRLRPRDG